jgi:hypothetical protein
MHTLYLDQWKGLPGSKRLTLCPRLQDAAKEHVVVNTGRKITNIKLLWVIGYR